MNLCGCGEKTVPWPAWNRGVRSCRACKSRDRRYRKMPTRQLEDAKRKHERRLESIESILSSRDRGPFVDEQEFGAIVRWYFDDLSPASVAEALRVATEARDGDQHLDGVDPDAEEIWSALRRLGSDCSAALLLRAPEHSES